MVANFRLLCNLQLVAPLDSHGVAYPSGFLVETRGIGRKIKSYRQQRGVTQMELADRIGVSYQQVQKYEKGQSQISIDRLYLVARALDTPLRSFLPEDDRLPLAEPLGPPPNREERLLLRQFASIRSPALRKTVLRLVESIVEQQRQ